MVRARRGREKLLNLASLCLNRRPNARLLNLVSQIFQRYQMLLNLLVAGIQRLKIDFGV
jgi:hypothetical protein